MDEFQRAILKNICILDSLFDCYPAEVKEKSIIVYKFQISFSEKKLPPMENVRMKSLIFFKHQINIIFMIFPCGSFFH